MKLTPRQSFQHRILLSLKVIADYCCTELGVKYSSFALIKKHDDAYKKVDGYCCEYGHIRIKLFNRKKHFHTLKYLIKVVVHECCHLVFFRHTDKFRALEKKLCRQALDTFEIP